MNVRSLKMKKKIKKDTFIKFSPLLDPIKYMIGKYKNTEKELILPLLNNKNIHKKILDKNNSAYIDGFFSYLSSQLLHTHNFYHGIDFFGSFIGIKKKFQYDITDDIDYLLESKNFFKYKDKKFNLEYSSENFNFGSRNNKEKISVGNNCELFVEKLDNTLFEGIFNDEKDISNNIVFNLNNNTQKTSKSESTCSSRSSNTSCSSIETTNDDENNMSDSDDESDTNSSLSSGENIYSYLFDFPVQIICLESLTNTLDSLIAKEDNFDLDEWKSCLIQIIMTLIVYQKTFNMTHNDLHTNNIMYVETDKEYLYYCYNKTYYKVPTFGRIYKIIDFGRAIYWYKGELICSDSYHHKGDAATQYNFGPYFIEGKKLIEPNKSFDLCRLACSLYDLFLDDETDEIDQTDPIAVLISKWCTDDKNKNILYKKNGDERYPDFKLYKMIARTVHNHTPEQQLEDTFFNKFTTKRKKISKKIKILNIDNLPDYT